MSFKLEGAQDADSGSATKRFKLEGAQDAPMDDPLSGGVREAFTTKSGSSVYDKPESMEETLKQLKTGFTEAGIGGMQLLNELGLETMPAFVNGKIKLVPVDQKMLADIQSNLEKEEGSGVGPWLERQAVNPVNFIAGPERLGLGAKSGLQAAISSIVSPSTNSEQKLGDRVTDAAIAAPLGFGVGRAVKAGGSLANTVADKVGFKTPSIPITPTTDNAGVLKWIKNFVAGTSKPGVSKDDKSLYDAAQRVGLHTEGKEPKQIYGELKDWYNKNVSNIALEQSGGVVAGDTHPVGANFAISEMYDKTSKATDKLYAEAYDIGSKQTIPAEGIKDGLEKVVNDLRSKAASGRLDPGAVATLNKLEPLYEELSSSSKMTLNQSLGYTPKEPEVVTAAWLARLKKTLNQYHVADPAATSKDVPYKQLGAKVRQEIEKTLPQFQQALGKADSAYSEQERIFANKTLSQFWDKKDYDALQAVKRGGNLNVDTKKRVEKMLDSIKTPADLESLQSALPKEYFDSVRSAKFHQIMSKAGLDAAAIDKNYDLIVKTLHNDAKAIQLVDAIKTSVEHMNERGVGNLNPAALAQNNKILERAYRAISSLIVSPKIHAVKKALEAVNTEPAGAVQQRVLDYAKSLKSGDPHPVYVPSWGENVIAKPLATSVGQQTQ